MENVLCIHESMRRYTIPMQVAQKHLAPPRCLFERGGVKWVGRLQAKWISESVLGVAI